MRFNRQPLQSFDLIERLEQRLLLSIALVGPEFRVNTFTLNNQAFPAVAMDARGDFAVAWHSTGGQDGSGAGIYAQRYNSLGAPIGAEFRVNSYTSLDQSYPSVAMDADGDFSMAWQSHAQDGSEGGIYAQRYNSSGVTQGGEFRVNTYAKANQSNAAVAMDADGNTVAAWNSVQEPGVFYDPYGVYAKRYNAAGQELMPPQGAPPGLGNEFHVNTYTTHLQGGPAVAMNADGDFVVAWLSFQEGAPFDAYGVYAQRYNFAGVPQGGEFHVNTHTMDTQAGPAVAMDATGNFVIAWESEKQEGSSVGIYDYGIYAQRYNLLGAAQGAEFRVNTYTTDAQRYAAVAMDESGEFIITWASFGQDGSGYGIYAQRYTAAGLATGNEFRVNTWTTSGQLNPSVAMDSDGDFLIAWDSAHQDGSSRGIYAQRYVVVPTVNTSAFLFNTAQHQLQFTFDENVSASLGTEDLVVQNLTTMQTIPPSDFSVVYDPLTNTGTFNYTGYAGGIPGVLPDGNYQATLLAAGVTTPNGNPLPADHVLEFFFLHGDANHDARVNLLDFDILAANFGQTGRDFTLGNFDYDPAGTVNLDDFNILAARFGQQVAPGAAGSMFPRQALFGTSSMPSRYNEHLNSPDVTEDDDGQIELLA